MISTPRGAHFSFFVDKLELATNMISISMRRYGNSIPITFPSSVLVRPPLKSGGLKDTKLFRAKSVASNQKHIKFNHT